MLKQVKCRRVVTIDYYICAIGYLCNRLNLLSALTCNNNNIIIFQKNNQKY